MACVKGVKMSEVVIKSHIKGRVRIKSDFFTASKTTLLSDLLHPFVLEFRHNVSARSLILVYDHTKITIEAILGLLEKQMNVVLPLHLPVASAQSYCSSCSSCSSCEVKANTPQTWKKKLITFGLLSGYALYLFVKETLLGIVVVSSPFSLTAAVALFAAIHCSKRRMKMSKRSGLLCNRLWHFHSSQPFLVVK